MSCAICGGELRQAIVDVCACDAMPVVLVENVPAMVCERCGERSFTEAIIRFFENIRRGVIPRARVGSVDIYVYRQEYVPMAEFRSLTDISGIGTASSAIPGIVASMIGAGRARQS